MYFIRKMKDDYEEGMMFRELCVERRVIWDRTVTYGTGGNTANWLSLTVQCDQTSRPPLVKPFTSVSPNTFFDMETTRHLIFLLKAQCESNKTKRKKN